MDILLILIPLSIVLMGFAAAAFVWAARGGQFEGFEDAARLPPDEPPAVSPSVSPGDSPSPRPPE